MCGAFGDWFEVEFSGQPRAYGGAASARVDLCQGRSPSCPEGNGRDADFNGWPVLNEVINRLSVSNLGPAGFFVICHRDFSDASAEKRERSAS
jgi:hypothetical protein